MNKTFLSLFCGLSFFVSSIIFPPAAFGQSTSTDRRPDWVNNPDDKYPQTQYIAASVDGLTAEESQYKARVNLLGIFGMKISDNLVINERYIETKSKGILPAFNINGRVGHQNYSEA